MRAKLLLLLAPIISAFSSSSVHAGPLSWPWLDLGSEVSLYDKTRNCYLAINATTFKVECTTVEGGTNSRFRVVDAKHGVIALYNVALKRFLKMPSPSTTAAPLDTLASTDGIPSSAGLELLMVEDAGLPVIRLYAPSTQRRYLVWSGTAYLAQSAPTNASGTQAGVGVQFKAELQVPATKGMSPAPNPWAPALATTTPTAPVRALGVLINRKKNLCLDVAGYNGAFGDNVALYACDQHRDQAWGFDGEQHIINGGQLACLDPGSYPSPNSNVALGICVAGKGTQEWWFREREVGWYEIVNTVSGLCLDADGYDGASDRNVQLSRCDNARDQHWRLDTLASVAKTTVGQVPAATQATFFARVSAETLLLAAAMPQADLALATATTEPAVAVTQYSQSLARAINRLERAPAAGKRTVKGLLVSKKQGLCLDPAGDAAASRAAVTLGPCTGAADQVFSYDATGEIKSAKSGLCLDAKGYDGAAGAAIILYACEQKNDQRWQLRDRNFGDNFELLNVAQGNCLDVAGSDGAANAAVALNGCSTTLDDQFQFETFVLGPFEIGKYFTLYNKQAKRFLTISIDGTVGASDVVEVVTSASGYYLRDGQVTNTPPTLKDLIPAGWYQAFFTAFYGGDGRVALHNKASRRFLRAVGSSVDASDVNESLPAGWTAERFQVVDLGGGDVALYQRDRGTFVTMTAQGTITQSATGLGVSGSGASERFQVIEPKAPTALAAASGANSTCVEAMSCLIDGSLQKAFESLCVCRANEETVVALLDAIVKNDMPKLCASGVKAAFDVADLITSSFVKSAAKKAIEIMVCPLTELPGGDPVCGNDPNCKAAFGKLCEPKALAEQWANKICSLETYYRGAGEPMSCAEGYQELTAGLCYPPCPAGYPDGTLTDCFSSVPSGYGCLGLVCTHATTLHTITRTGVTRGVAVALSECPGEPELDGALCYPPCFEGFKGVADTCWKQK